MKKFKLKKIFRPDWTIENARNRNLLWLDIETQLKILDENSWYGLLNR